MKIGDLIHQLLFISAECNKIVSTYACCSHSFLRTLHPFKVFSTTLYILFIAKNTLKININLTLFHCVSDNGFDSILVMQVAIQPHESESYFDGCRLHDGSAISITYFIVVGEIIFMLTVVFTYMYMNF